MKDDISFGLDEELVPLTDGREPWGHQRVRMVPKSKVRALQAQGWRIYDDAYRRRERTAVQIATGVAIVGTVIAAPFILLADFLTGGALSRRR